MEIFQNRVQLETVPWTEIEHKYANNKTGFVTVIRMNKVLLF